MYKTSDGLANSPIAIELGAKKQFPYMMRDEVPFRQ